MGQTAGDDGMDALRNRNLGPARLAPHTLNGHEAHRLDYKKRVSVRLLMQCRDELGGGNLGRRQIDVLGNLGLGQPHEREASSHGFSYESADRLGQGPSGDGVDVSVGADDEHPHRPELAGQELEQKKRGHVCRMEVVEEEQDRSGLRGPP